MKRLSVCILLLVSLNTFATDYSDCQFSILQGRVNEKGDIVPWPGEKIISQTRDKDKESITLQYASGGKLTFDLTRDKDNRITSVKSLNKELSDFSKKERDEMRKSEAYKLAFSGSYHGNCDNVERSRPRSGNGGGMGVGAGYALRECPSVWVFNEGSQSYSAADYSVINEENFSKFKFKDITTWDEFKKARDLDKKKWRADQRVAKAYEKVLDLQGWSIPNGSKMEFDYENDSCAISKVSSLQMNGKNGAIMEVTQFDVKECERLKPVVDKWKDELVSCENKVKESSQDMWDAILNRKPDPYRGMTLQFRTPDSPLLLKGFWCDVHARNYDIKTQSQKPASSKQ